MTPLVLLAAFMACTSSDSQGDSAQPGPSTTDGGNTDGGSTDGGATDGGTDGGTTDGGTTDGGTTDGGTDGGSTAVVYDAVQVSGIELRLHATYGSLLYVAWQQEAPASVYVEYSFDDGEWLQSPAQDVDLGAQEHLLLGIPYGAEVQVRVVNDFGDASATGEAFATEVVATTTDALPDGVPRAVSVTGDAATWDADSRYFLLGMSSGGGWGDFWSFIVDRQGRVVWALETDSSAVTLHPRISRDGNELLIDSSTYWAIFDGGDASTITRMKIDGSSAETIATPGLYHAFTDLDGGELAWTAHDGVNDLIIRRAADGTLTELWNCHDDLPGVPNSSYCASNTLSFSDSRGSFLYSCFTSDTVAEIDVDTGETLRIFGHLDESWAFDPVDSAFEWQHGSHFTDAGTLLISSDHQIGGGTETVVREYELDADSETLVEVWNMGVGDGIYGIEMGEAHRLPGGNTLQNTGLDSRLREATPDGEIVWEVNWDEYALGRSTPLEDLYMLAP